MQERYSVPIPATKREEMQQMREFPCRKSIHSQSCGYRRTFCNSGSTVDNGKELIKHLEIAEKLKISFYLCKTYHSWERGANENTN